MHSCNISNVHAGLTRDCIIFVRQRPGNGQQEAETSHDLTKVKNFKTHFIFC